MSRCGEPHIKALYAFDPDGARAAAKASTDRWQNGEPIGLLDGVPATIKDNIRHQGACRCRSAPPPPDWYLRRWMHRRQRGCARLVR